MNRFLVAIVSMAAITMALGCHEKPVDAANVATANISDAVKEDAPLAGTEICGSRETYNSVKDIVFDEAIKQAAGDTVALNDLRRGIAVSMEFPLVKNINEQLHRTDCSGRLTFGLPPGVASAFGGEKELKADVLFSVQPAADGNGNVITADGIGFLVNRLVQADALRSALKVANAGGPQLEKTFNPSFDCGRRLSNVERMICQDEGLAAKDRTLSSAFKRKLAFYAADERADLLSNQRDALAERARCPDIQCVNDWYDSTLLGL